MAKRVTRWQAETDDSPVFDTQSQAIAHEMEKGPLFDEITQFVTAESPTNAKYHDTQVQLILAWEAAKAQAQDVAGIPVANWPEKEHTGDVAEQMQQPVVEGA